MTHIINYLNQQDRFQAIEASIQAGDHQLVTGLSGSGRSLHLLSLLNQQDKTILVVEANALQANRVYEDLQGLLAEDALHLYSVDETLQLDQAVTSPEIHGQRVDALRFLMSNKSGIVVTTLSATKQALPPRQAFEKATLHFSMDSEVDVDRLPEKLVTLGYSRKNLVVSPGEFSIRGGIVDVYPLDTDYPIRIELFDVEVDSIRYFDPESQRSIENLDQVEILPARENFFLKEWKLAAAEKVRAMGRDQVQHLEGGAQENLESKLQDILGALEDDDPYEGLALYAPLIYPRKAGLVDYLSDQGLLVLDEYPRLVEANRSQSDEDRMWLEDKIEAGHLLPLNHFGLDFRDQVKDHQGPLLYYSIFEKGMGQVRLDGLHHFQYRAMQQFFSQMEMLATEVNRWMKQDYAVVIAANKPDRIEEIQDILREYEIETQSLKEGQPVSRGEVQLVTCPLSNGFELLDEKIAIISEKELFNRVAKKRPRRVAAASNAEKLKSYSELEAGDYVVHVNHGIGRYLGIETIEISGSHQDYLTIIYRDDAKVFVPVDQLQLVQKYVGSEGKSPRLHKLGGTEWVKTKQKVRQQVEDISEDLINLYAEREAEEGYAFSPDNDYQAEFEAAFPYVETEDQMRSIKEVKADMEKTRPMDRLLVGDVGYGKTEVAMRAIFKAVQDGKQAAFLVPTTVLAQQHYRSLIERFQDFPVEIDVLSRFKTKSQQDKTVADLKDGKVDVVVGTHRLLSQDVEFSDLGLLVVDEEQRFGVKHKERLKQLKQDVDVLTMTATPIPRTLHMSMLGVRDLSVIETPPANRYPVQTYVMEMNAGAIRQAVEREVARGGQVFYLHNRVATMPQRVAQLEELLPEARIGFAHGQMSEAQLEDVLFSFLEGDYDVLVTTTIIETGVDMPNVNTLIVEDADRLGLSQLYQLRGRVGRSSRVAYAYLMYEGGRILKEESVKRLQALREFSELGAGFKIAMRDLSIRGAGDILGKQQSGFIDSVGYDMYTQLLQEAVKRKKNQESQDRTQLEVKADLNAYIPESYVEDDHQKFDLYKRINSMESQEDTMVLQDDMIDRFGDYPQEVSDLMAVGEIKMYGERALVEKIVQEKHRRDQTVTVIFSAKASSQVPGPEFFRALQDIPVKVDVKMKKDKIHVIFFLDKKLADNIWLDYVLKFVENMATYQDDQWQRKEEGSKQDQETKKGDNNG